MAIKLFVSDIDGTLLLPGKNPSAKNVEAVRKMTDAGIIVTIATGRMYRAALPIAKYLGVNVPIITYNGAMIKSADGEILYSSYLAPEVVAELIDFFREKNIHLQTYSEDVLRYAEKNKFSKQYELDQQLEGQAVGWENLKNFTSQVCKVLSISENAQMNVELIAELKEKFAGKIDITKSTPVFAEIINPGVSKAAAVKILAKKFGFDKSEIAAIGDGDNDLPMLLEAGTSIAMANGTDDVKKSCTVQTGKCEDDGFAEAVDKYILR